VSELDPSRLAAVLQREIPISQALGVNVLACSPQYVILDAPLAPNHNHRGTAFGGSLSAVALLAAYGLVWAALEHAGYRAAVLVGESSTRYLRPVTRDFAARCDAPEGARLDSFLDTLRRRRRSRIILESSIRESGELAVAFRGSFVAVAE
jgi:thioesterase domain-containing protein